MPDTATVSDIIFERSLSLSEQAHTDGAIATNDAFVAAMSRAIRAHKENARHGTFVDTTPPISAIRIRGTIQMSCCGSPAAMCVDYGSEHGGTESMK